eukprot:GHVH01004100.1.p1 GENE.GHVH01004100.1~~GHVH01004100.1.p1  ORF type:complete len:507 (+),score=77.29 GHVH01004100.1:102-1523(+)
MSLVLVLPQDSLSANEFLDREGELVEAEKEYLRQVRNTVLAHVEPIDSRLERYQSYFDISDENYMEYYRCLSSNYTHDGPTLDLKKLASVPLVDKFTCSVELSHSSVIISKLSTNGDCVERKTKLISEIMKGYELSASELFNWIAGAILSIISADGVSKLKKNGKLVNVVFYTSHDLSADGQCIVRLSGGFCEKRPTDNTFKGVTCDDPVVGIPLNELMNFALKNLDVPAACVGVYPSSYGLIASTVVSKHEPFAFMAITLSDGVQHCVTDWGTHNTPCVSNISFDNCTASIPANNIDQNYKFMQSRRRSNPLNMMISSEAIADLTRMTWYHVCQDQAQHVCWMIGSLKCEDVLETVFHPEKAGSILSSWLKVEVTDDDIRRFKCVANMVVNRTIILIAGVIAACAEASGRCYDAFGISRCIVRGSTLIKYPKFFEMIHNKVKSTVNQGQIEIVPTSDDSCQGTSVIGQYVEL